VTKKAAQTKVAQPKINQLGAGEGQEVAQPQTRDLKSATDTTRPRLRLRSLDDTLRAHARLLRANFGKVEADVYSRMLKRHADMLSERYIQSLDEQLRERNALTREAQRVIEAPLPENTQDFDA